MTHKIFSMSFASVYGALVAKVERKGGSQEDVDAVTVWLTGYSRAELAQLAQTSATYGEFIAQAPSYHTDRIHITGKICGVQIEQIEDEQMREVRRLDKLVDWLAKGKAPQEVMAKYEQV